MYNQVAVYFSQSFSTCETLTIPSPLFCSQPSFSDTHNPSSTPISSSFQQNIHHLFRIPTSTDRMYNLTLCRQRWWIPIVLFDHDWVVDYSGTRSWWELIADYKINKTAWQYTFYSLHPLHFWGIPRMWLFLRCLRFSCQKGFCSFSLLLLRVKGRWCHNLRSSIGQFSRIWAIQNNRLTDEPPPVSRPRRYSCWMLCSTPF